MPSKIKYIAIERMIWACQVGMCTRKCWSERDMIEHLKEEHGIEAEIKDHEMIEKEG